MTERHHYDWEGKYLEFVAQHSLNGLPRSYFLENSMQFAPDDDMTLVLIKVIDVATHDYDLPTADKEDVIKSFYKVLESGLGHDAAWLREFEECFGRSWKVHIRYKIFDLARKVGYELPARKLVDLFIEQNTGKNKVEPSETELGIRKIMDESLSRMREINEKRMKEWIEQHEWNPDEKEWVLKKK